VRGVSHVLGKPRRRRKMLFASLAVIAGLVLIGLELARPGKTTVGERWFWFVVAALLVGMGMVELLSSRDGDDQRR
jgi:hypothetical protein